MKEEYDIENLNPRKNPYSKRLKKQITINIDNDTIDFFKEQSEKTVIPYWHNGPAVLWNGGYGCACSYGQYLHSGAGRLPRCASLRNT